MKKKYIVEFTEQNGEPYEFEFITDDIEFSIEQYGRNRVILSHRIINEGNDNRKQMLFG